MGIVSMPPILHGWQGIHCNGTIKANRKNIPKQAVFKDTGAQKKARGAIHEVHS
jgi:hypothetical protein